MHRPETVIVAAQSPARTINTPFAVALGVTDRAAYRELRGKLRARLVEVTADKRTARETIISGATAESRSLAQGYRHRARLAARALHIILAGLRGRTKAVVLSAPDPVRSPLRPVVSLHWTADACDTALRNAGDDPATRARFAVELTRWWGLKPASVDSGVYP